MFHYNKRDIFTVRYQVVSMSFQIYTKCFKRLEVNRSKNDWRSKNEKKSWNNLLPTAGGKSAASSDWPVFFNHLL